jgi:hypothetical protein
MERLIGLDMYLTARKYIGGDHEHRGVRGSIKITAQQVVFDQQTAKYVPKIGTNPRVVIELDDMSLVSEIEFKAAYWRKANAIHRWFVEECQEGVDECQTTYLEREKLESLLAKCKLAKKLIEDGGTEKGEVECGLHLGPNGEWIPKVEPGTVYLGVEKAADVLPTTSGFFFGSTDYDQWYVQDIDNTIEQLEAVFANPLFDECCFYYHSSW